MKVLLTILDFRALSWDNVGFLWKSQFGVIGCATAYGMFYAFKFSLVLSIPYRKNIQSPAVTRCRIPGIFCHQIQKRRDWPLTWWLFSFGRFIRQENPSYRFLKSGNNITVIFTKSTRYCACLNQIIPDWSSIEICWQRAKKWEVERRNSQGLDKVIHVYPTNLAL